MREGERDVAVFGSPPELRVPQPVVQAFRSGFRFTPTLGKHAGLTSSGVERKKRK